MLMTVNDSYASLMTVELNTAMPNEISILACWPTGCYGVKIAVGRI